MDPSPISIAICGGGACGLAVVLGFLEEGKRGSRSIGSIYIYEKRTEVGPGLAYSEDCGNAIMNMEAKTMGLYAHDPLHFSRWVKTTHPEFDGVRYPPRSLYGEYLTLLF